MSLFRKNRFGLWLPILHFFDGELGGNLVCPNVKCCFRGLDPSHNPCIHSRRHNATCHGTCHNHSETCPACQLILMRRPDPRSSRCSAESEKEPGETTSIPKPPPKPSPKSPSRWNPVQAIRDFFRHRRERAQLIRRFAQEYQGVTWTTGSSDLHSHFDDYDEWNISPKRLGQLCRVSKVLFDRLKQDKEVSFVENWTEASPPLTLYNAFLWDRTYYKYVVKRDYWKRLSFDERKRVLKFYSYDDDGENEKKYLALFEEIKKLGRKDK